MENIELELAQRYAAAPVVEKTAPPAVCNVIDFGQATESLNLAAAPRTEKALPRENRGRDHLTQTMNDKDFLDEINIFKLGGGGKKSPPSPSGDFGPPYLEMTTDNLPFPDTPGNCVFYLPEAMEVDGKTFPRNAKLILTTHEDGSREIEYTPMVLPPLPHRDDLLNRGVLSALTALAAGFVLLIVNIILGANLGLSPQVSGMLVLFGTFSVFKGEMERRKRACIPARG
jgi:hypothetical protein